MDETATPRRTAATAAALDWLTADDEAWAALPVIVRMSRNQAAFERQLAGYAEARRPGAWDGVNWAEIAVSYLTMVGKVIDPDTGGLSTYQTRQ